MLSSASADGQVRMSPRGSDETPNEAVHQILPRMGSDVLSEDILLARNTIMLDADMYWEMNYHEAAIFLEVLIIATV